MARSLGAAATGALRDGVPFLVVTVLWSVVMLVVYGAFLLTKPDVSYPAWVHASVFVPPLIGFAGHVLHQVLVRYAGEKR